MAKETEKKGPWGLAGRIARHRISCARRRASRGSRAGRIWCPGHGWPIPARPYPWRAQTTSPIPRCRLPAFPATPPGGGTSKGCIPGSNKLERRRSQGVGVCEVGVGAPSEVNAEYSRQSPNQTSPGSRQTPRFEELLCTGELR
jgi:hypothetical protein